MNDRAFPCASVQEINARCMPLHLGNLYTVQSIIYESIHYTQYSQLTNVFRFRLVLMSLHIGKLEHHDVMMRWYHNLYKTPCM